MCIYTVCVPKYANVFTYMHIHAFSSLMQCQCVHMHVHVCAWVSICAYVCAPLFPCIFSCNCFHQHSNMHQFLQCPGLVDTFRDFSLMSISTGMYQHVLIFEVVIICASTMLHAENMFKHFVWRLLSYFMLRLLVQKEKVNQEHWDLCLYLSLINLFHIYKISENITPCKAVLFWWLPR